VGKKGANAVDAILKMGGSAALRKHLAEAAVLTIIGRTCRREAYNGRDYPSGERSFWRAAGNPCKIALPQQL
jgi:hypothetical protein